MFWVHLILCSPGLEPADLAALVAAMTEPREDARSARSARGDLGTSALEEARVGSRLTSGETRGWVVSQTLRPSHFDLGA